MLKCRKLLALVALICSYSLQVDVHAAPSPLIDVLPAGDAKKVTKRNIQAVVRPDGRIVDRLVDANPVDAKSSTKQRSAPDTPEAWLARMMDPTKNGLAAKHPELFAEWLDAVTEPRFMTALASVAVSPEAYAKTLGKMTDPATARNWVEFVDPQLYVRWMNAGINPQFYQSLFIRMTDSTKLRRWGVFFGAKELPQANEAGVVQDVGGESWLQLPAREANKNPWLSNNTNYRY